MSAVDAGLVYALTDDAQQAVQAFAVGVLTVGTGILVHKAIKAYKADKLNAVLRFQKVKSNGELGEAIKVDLASYRNVLRSKGWEDLDINKLFDDMAESEGLARYLLSDLERVGAWEFVFDGTSIRTRVDVLESISTALQRGVKDVPDIVSYAGHPNIVGYTVEHIFRGHGNNGGRHHISALIADNSRKLVDRLKETSDGFYEAVIKKSDGSTSTKSFWPDTWDENQIMDELKYVMTNNPVNIPGTNNWEGFTTGGQKVRYYVKASDDSIISAFPVLD
jgi:hypothetical protein